MNLAKLNAFIVVAEELNFSRSAEILGMSQPPLTRLIASLEDELGTKLFERTTRQVKLTSAGVFLLKEARELLARADAIEEQIRAIGKIKSGLLSVGFSQTSFLARLPKIVSEFQDRHPKISLDLHQESRVDVIRGLKKGRFDVGFVEGLVSEKELDSCLVHDEILGVLLPRKHPLARRKEIELQELRNETIILHPRQEHAQFFDTIQQLFQQNAIAPKTYIKKRNESCPILVSIGKGVILTIASSQALVPTETRFVPIKRLYLPVSLGWSKSSENPLLQSFVSFAVENASLGEQKAECLMDVMLVELT